MIQTEQMANAIKLLADAEAAARKQAKATKGSATNGRFPGGTEWELLHADATILLGLTHALRYAHLYVDSGVQNSRTRTANRIWVMCSACKFRLRA